MIIYDNPLFLIALHYSMVIWGMLSSSLIHMVFFSFTKGHLLDWWIPYITKYLYDKYRNTRRGNKLTNQYVLFDSFIHNARNDEEKLSRYIQFCNEYIKKYKYLGGCVICTGLRISLILYISIVLILDYRLLLLLPIAMCYTYYYINNSK